MKVAVIGRTQMLLAAAERILARGHTIPLVWTAKHEEYYSATSDDFKHFADSIGAAYVHSASINNEASLDILFHAGCDIAVSVNFPNVIGEKALQAFPLGILNAHAGDLPRYRGNACANWAILNGESKVGLCIHTMAPELDAGPVVLRAYYPLDTTVYIGEIYDWMERAIPQLMADAIQGLADGTLSAVPQSDDPSLILRAFPRRPEDSRIDWTQPARDIHALIRASSHPFSGAFTFWEGKDKLCIWRAEPYIPAFQFCAVPGQVCMAVNGDPVIACSDAMLRLEDIQFEALSPVESKLKLTKNLRARLM